MGVYHQSATPTVAFNPYLPAIGRLLEVLRAYEPGTTIETCNRDLGIAAGCSAGRVPALLRTLEADGMIERATGPRGSLIVVVERSTMPDRNSASQCAHPHVDRRAEADSPNRAETPDRSEEPSLSDQARDQHVDPPHTPLYGTQESLSQEEESRALGLPFEMRSDPLYQHLTAKPAMNRKLAEQIVKNPLGTVADFIADVRLAQTFARDPFFFTVGRWRDGQRVVAPEESQYGYSARSVQPDPAARQSKRPAQPQSHFPAGWGVPSWLADSGGGAGD